MNLERNYILMKFDLSAPAVVLHSGLGGLTVVRSLGHFGVTVTCADSDLSGYAMKSKYCSERLLLPDIEADEDGVLKVLIQYGKNQSIRPVLYPLTDQYVLFVAKFREQLEKYFIFNVAAYTTLERLVNKLGMFEISEEHNLPAPITKIPKSVEDLEAMVKDIGLPCLLKTAYSHSPLKNTKNFMTKVFSLDELKETYQRLSAIDPNLMIQEYISGEDNNIHIFAGYFDSESNPKLVFTGRKIRQAPMNYGAGSMCECLENKALEKIMVDFCRSIKFKGNIDVGLKWDAAKGYCKVLDINPRLGMNHRTFITEDKKLDLARILYLDMTQDLPEPLLPRLGRKWMIEDADLIIAPKYIKENRLTYKEWFSSYKGLEEVAFFSIRDWRPWLFIYGKRMEQVFYSLRNKLKIR